MAIHRIIMETTEIAAITDFIGDHIKAIKDGEITYGSFEDNKEQVELLDDLRKRLSDEVDKAWSKTAAEGAK